MRRLLWLILTLALYCSTGLAASAVQTFSAFDDEVRQKIGIEDTLMLPDSTLYGICQRAITYVSYDIPCVEGQYRTLTVEGQSMYAVPDSIVRLIAAETHSSDGSIFSLRQVPPLVYSELNQDGSLTSDATESDIPPACAWWADTLGLFPIPVRSGDTVILRVYIEHRLPDTSTNDTLLLPTGHIEAALAWASMEALESVDMFDKAARYESAYDKQRQKLLEITERQIDLIRPQ